MFNMFNLNQSSGSCGYREIKDYNISNTESIIKHSGPLKIINSTVNEEINVSGSMEAEHSVLNNKIQVAGLAKINNSLVSGAILKVAGAVSLNYSNLTCSATFGSNNVEIFQSNTQDIIITKSSHEAQQIVVLDHAIINGDITFEFGQGVVKSFSSEIKGQVIGGHVVQLATSPQCSI